MAVPVGLFMKEVSLTLKVGAGSAQEFNCHLKSAILEGEPGDVVTYVTLCTGGSMSQQAAPIYTLHLIGVQEWLSATTSLARYLALNVGATAAFVYNAHGLAVPSATAPAYQGNCIIVPVDYGGERDTYAEFDVSLPVSGIPLLITAAPTVFAELEAELAAEAKAAKAA